MNFINPEKRNEPSCKNEVVQNLQKRSVQKSTSAQYKKAPKKHISSVLFYCSSFGYLTKNH